ncbi:glycosyltransferase [Deefgea salmonis]|uniref:Glycosyltransferase n=1 Tax=Deefgea salmonis TaxID=2875502 RepID=A0ABS8BNR1_9NEIS|nr:glycosyltransferase [Deefgea salmonis]MCB5197373.1 glycosyltransferase [Deefgea salmonis]
MSLKEIDKSISSLDDLLLLQDEYFIFHAYKILLGRIPDPGGANYYLSRIQSGVGKLEILGQLRCSKEGQVHSEKLIGLDAAISRIRRQRWPVIGRLFKDNIKENDIEIKLIDSKLRILDEKLEKHNLLLNSALHEIKTEISKLSSVSFENTKVFNSTIEDDNAKEELNKDIMMLDINEELISDESEYDVLQKSGLFDVNYYLSTYTDVAQENVNALSHYLSDGWQEGRNPSADFDTKYYLLTNHDVAESGSNPLLHYIKYGRDEGRMPSEISATLSVRSVLPLFSQEKNINKFQLDYPIDIVIPVYNGYDYLDALFSSIIKNSSMRYRLIVINDSSPDQRVAEFIEGFLVKNPLIDFVLITNEVNLGFVKSVNKAVGYVKNHFVLLNTDTEVPSQWLERLMYPIFTMDNIASTTPFTNAGTICSFPRYLEDNSIFEGLDVEELDSYFKSINVNNSMIEIPTGVGFCMGVNKYLVDEIGMFDEVFGKGYGEENDWCQRAVAHGYKNLHIPNLFVFHKHGGSFDSETKKKLIENNYKILTKKHSDYEKQVQLTIQENKLELVRKLLELRVVSNTRSSYLIIDHNLGGGANHYADEKKAEYLQAGYLICTVKFDFSQTKQYLIEFNYDDVVVIFKAEEVEDLYKFISAFNFHNVFINSFVSFENIPHHLDEIISLKVRLGTATKLVVPIHDFFPVCSNYTLLDETGTFCDVPTDLDKCVNCLKKNTGEFKIFEAPTDIYNWRANWGKLLNIADEILCFSESSKEILLKAYPEQYEKVIVTPHDISGRHPVIFVPRKNPSELRIGVLGGINEAKGANIILKLVNYFDESDIPAKLILIGEISIPIMSSSFEKTGRYNKNELEKIVLDKEIDVFLIPSIWPETYSYTTDEIMQMGYPLIVFNYGAPAERVCQYELGEVVGINQLNKTIDDFAKRIGIITNKRL